MSNLAEQAEHNEVMNVPETAALLRIAPKTVRIMAKDGRLPAKKVGTEWRFLKSNLEQWLSGGYSDREQKPAGIANNKEAVCRSSNVVTHIGSISGTKDAEYEKALGL